MAKQASSLRVKSAWAIASFFGSGFFPKAPGTMGSLAALPLAWWVWNLGSAFGWVFFLLLLALGIWAADEVIESSGVQDNQKIVIDEVLGILLTTSAAPKTLLAWSASFLLFRIADIFKPFPASWLDRHWKGGLGCIADDLGAALWSTAAILLCKYAGLFS